MRPRVLILGGGYAGQLAAARLAKRTPAEITVIDASEAFTERIRLHQVAAGDQIARTPMQALLPSAVQFRRARVVGLQPQKKAIVVEQGSRFDEVSYDYLVLALGSTIDLDSVAGAREHAHAFTSRGAAEAVARLQPRERIAVVGGGLTGIETATELAEAYPGTKVTLVSSNAPGSDLSVAGQKHLQQALKRLRIEVKTGARVQRVEHDRLLFSDGTEIGFDLCLWSTGFVAADLARAANLPVNSLGQVRVLPTLQVPGIPEIFVAGDAAEVLREDGVAIRMGCVSAEPMGVHAGEELARLIRGKAPRPFEFAFQIRCISLGRRDGLVQFVDAFDQPRSRIIGGRLGAMVKELICRYTVDMIRLERSLPFPVYWWAKPRRPAAMQGPAIVVK